MTFTDGSTVLGSAPLAPVVGSGVPTSLFGLTTTWTYLTPPVNYQTVRSLSMQPWIYWEEVNPSNGTYNWANLDAWVAANAGKDMIYDLAYTPQWASLYPNNNAGACSPPSSLTYWDSYLTAIATRYPQIKYWEIWNEPQDPMAMVRPDCRLEWPHLNVGHNVAACKQNHQGNQPFGSNSLACHNQLVPRRPWGSMDEYLPERRRDV